MYMNTPHPAQATSQGHWPRLPVDTLRQMASGIVGHNHLVQRASARFDSVNWVRAPRLSGLAFIQKNNLQSTSALTPADVDDVAMINHVQSMLPDRVVPRNMGAATAEMMKKGLAFFQPLNVGNQLAPATRQLSYMAAARANHLEEALPVSGFINEYSPLMTRQEILAGFASVHPRNIAAGGVHARLEELHAFVNAHEFAHGMNRGYAMNGDDARLTYIKSLTPEQLAQETAGKRGLGFVYREMAKTQNENEPYARYMDEVLADTTAALTLLKEGVNPAAINEVSRARAMGTYNALIAQYNTAPVLDQVVRHADYLKDQLHDLNQEQVHEMAMEMVSNCGFTREGYYAQAAYILHTVAQDVNVPTRKAFFDAHKDYGILEMSIDQEAAQRFRAGAEAYRDDASRQLITPMCDDVDMQVCELEAAIQYAQGRQPEYATPAGSVYLAQLKEREMLAEGVPSTDTRMQAIARVKDYHRDMLPDAERTVIRNLSPQQEALMERAGGLGAFEL